MAIHGRQARLILEYEKLINLERRSEFIKIEPVEVIEGMPPENYLITFTCRGIAGLNEDKSPRITDFHQVSMKLSREFPNQEPYLKWVTPIWHPNIEHNEPHHVCTNNVQNWFATKSLDNLVQTLGEMVQYRRYHAAWVAPFPLDKEAADWVVEFAEPQGIIGPEKPVDERELLRPQKTRLGGGAKAETSETPIPKPKSPTGKLILGPKKSADQHSRERLITQETKNPAENVSENGGAPVRKIGITLGKPRIKGLVCMRCGESFSIPVSTGETEVACPRCGAVVANSSS